MNNKKSRFHKYGLTLHFELKLEFQIIQKNGQLSQKIPSMSVPLRASTAFCASSCFSRATKPKPLEFPSLSFMTATLLTTPYF